MLVSYKGFENYILYIHNFFTMIIRNVTPYDILQNKSNNLVVTNSYKLLYAWTAFFIYFWIN